MIRQLGIPGIAGALQGELIVDLFAGGGGASHGIEMALGRCVDVAVNHDEHAISMHRLNHPSTQHYCESVFDIDPVQVTQGQPVGLLWASPDCTHFSRAKGGKPRSQKIRGLAWIIVDWAKAVRPRVICMENVEEFKTWGPLDAEGQPIEARKGETFEEFKAAMRALGYAVEFQSRIACKAGAPTTRKRLFGIMRSDGLPIVWPEATHGDGLKPYRTAADCIDWSDLGSSIFDRKRQLADATCRRIAHGIMRYVVDAADPFIVKFGTDDVAPVVTKFQQNGHGQDARTPLHTVMAGASRFALVSAFLAKHYTGVVGQDMRRPLGTVTAIDHHSLVGATLIQTGYGEREGQAPRVPGLDKPLGTIMGGGCKHALVGAFITKYYGNGPEQTQAAGDPLHTITTRARFGLVTVAIDGAEYVITDILLRMLKPRELARAQGFPDDYQLIGTQAQQVARIGNSVSPIEACALVRANLVPLVATVKRRRKAA